jgi:TPR repeat protein
VRLYRLAADHGIASAQFSLGVCYETGTGVDQDHAEGVRLYRLSADQGSAVAQQNLARLGV